MALVNLQPNDILKQVADALPEGSRENIIVIGSLAAGHYFSQILHHGGIRTKDVDCMLWPNASVKVLASKVAEELIEHGWQLKLTGAHPQSYDEDTKIENLPLVRLHPTGEDKWFLELLNSPNAELMQGSMRSMEKVKTKHGYFALCGFKYLSLVEIDPIKTRHALSVARPQMMALANLLHHPSIGTEKIGDTNIKRSNKDLGRVLALAYLMNENKEDLRLWPKEWLAALQIKFPEQANELALRAGTGLRELLARENDFDQAVKTCNEGLLANYRVTAEQLRFTAMRFMADVVDPIEVMVQ
ncbi:hypothetical protein [Polynucleobacter sp. P1-05-14]|uniref:hypothetical protein n=1 Tax=Polynucleobacter sp. P1-05-14 TaxID=1819732 RepID=UPI001C0DEEA2|nr:hypothetical protein [Polynucleobacter sp. P1-05-14]MBU3548046.1 hypothetical protein [Polynucleobacter sp. P1-05-14]